MPEIVTQIRLNLENELYQLYKNRRAISKVLAECYGLNLTNEEKWKEAWKIDGAIEVIEKILSMDNDR